MRRIGMRGPCRSPIRFLSSMDSKMIKPLALPRYCRNGSRKTLIWSVAFSTMLTACAVSERQDVTVANANVEPEILAAQKESRNSIDPQIQMLVSKALAKGVVAFNAADAVAVVVEVDSGKIRALARVPNGELVADLQDQNQLLTREITRAATVRFPMGSLTMPLLVARAIETGRIKPNTMFDTHGALIIGRTEIRDAHPEEFMSVSDIIVKSSNVGGAKIALLLPFEDLSQTLGFDQSLQITGSNATGLSDSIDWKNWSGPMRALPGMNLETSLLQAVAAYMPIANGGVMRPLTILESSTHKLSGTRIFAPKTAADVREILVRVTSTEGTAPKARVTGIPVAGKTSTITSSLMDQKCDGGEIKTATLPSAAFIGMAPADHPRWLVGVVFRFPKDATLAYGGDTAAPVFAEIVEGMLKHELQSND